MKKYIYIAICMTLSLVCAACSDDDSFTSSPNSLLTFGADTLSLDTVFSTVPSPHKILMVRNNSGDGLRITNIRLNKGNQTGFRVNVNGSFLGEESGWQVNDLELRKNDSLRVFVELTSTNNNDTVPRMVSDDLVFSLESGVKQRLNLNAWSWDAFLLRDLDVRNDTVISNKYGRPVVVYGDIKVSEGATLTVSPGTTMYFHDRSGINVGGCLKINGEKDKEVTLRCDRLDRMVSNLTYDNNPGQWGGVTFGSKSFGNEIRFTDLHGATDAIICDSSNRTDISKLIVSNVTIHNVKGNGLKTVNSKVTISNTQISNARDTCLAVIGGVVDINNSTIVQYYPFDSGRGPALVFGNTYNHDVVPLKLDVKNSIIKGYSDDVVYKIADSEDSALTVSFANSILRTPKVDDSERMKFSDCVFEDTKDTLTNARNSFVLFDTENFFYDFTPKAGTAAIGSANASTALPEDRKGKIRNSEKPDVGCYETEK